MKILSWGFLLKGSVMIISRYGCWFGLYLEVYELTIIGANFGHGSFRCLLPLY